MKFSARRLKKVFVLGSRDSHLWFVFLLPTSSYAFPLLCISFAMRSFCYALLWQFESSVMLSLSHALLWNLPCVPLALCSVRLALPQSWAHLIIPFSALRSLNTTLFQPWDTSTVCSIRLALPLLYAFLSYASSALRSLDSTLGFSRQRSPRPFCGDLCREYPLFYSQTFSLRESSEIWYSLKH